MVMHMVIDNEACTVGESVSEEHKDTAKHPENVESQGTLDDIMAVIKELKTSNKHMETCLKKPP